MMGRLIVEAVSDMPNPGDVDWGVAGGPPAMIVIGVSVSRAVDGAPVTGLGADNFGLAWDPTGMRHWSTGSLETPRDYHIVSIHEYGWAETWETPAWPPTIERRVFEPSGCYRLWLKKSPGTPFNPGGRVVIGLQVRTFDGRQTFFGHRTVVDQGQTILELTSSWG
jgi:hypothetical protein